MKGEYGNIRFDFKLTFLAYSIATTFDSNQEKVKKGLCCPVLFSYSKKLYPKGA